MGIKGGKRHKQTKTHGVRNHHIHTQKSQFRVFKLLEEYKLTEKKVIFAERKYKLNIFSTGNTFISM